MLGEVKAPAPGQLGFKPKSNTTREAPFPLLYCALGEGHLVFSRRWTE